MDRHSMLVRLFALVAVVFMLSACSSDCVPDPDNQVYCEGVITGL